MEPHEVHGELTHVRNALARFDQVKGVSDAEREEAFANIKAAAQSKKVTAPHSRHEE